MRQSNKRVSHYVLKEMLGRGTFGEVFRGEDTLTQEVRAIKMIANSQLMDERQKENLKREVSIMKRLNHQNIVKLYDHIVSSRYNYLIIEYCSGGDLNNPLKIGIGEMKTIVYLRQMVSALKVLHENGIVHRDLKPANILLTSDNTIKLADFGLARKIDTESLAKTCVGTPLYMAPEVFFVKDDKNIRYAYKADIWSIGCIVYELITGRRPFIPSSLAEAIPTIKENISSAEFYKPEYFSDVCLDFLKRIFILNPEDRISFDEFCDHPFIIGAVSIKSIVGLKGLDSIYDDFDGLSKDEALDFSEVVIKIAENVSYPFLLHMKACMLLKPYLNQDPCNCLFELHFEQANKFKNKTDWESVTLTQLVIETVIQMCQGDSIRSNLVKENYKQALTLLKCLKPSVHIIKLKDAIKSQIKDSLL